MDEARLIEKLRLVEALFAGAATEGEKAAATGAKQRILERLRLWEREVPPVEYKFSLGDTWSRKVFVALLRRYGIRPYRYRRQRHTTVMARVSHRFVDETLWPEFREISETLRIYLADVTDRVISQVIHQDSSEADVVESAQKLLHAADDRFVEPTTVTRRQNASSRGLSKATLKTLVEEATVDTYGESEQTVGLFTMIEDSLELPFVTKIFGMEAAVEKVDLSGRGDIIVICRRGSHQQRLPILDLPLPVPPPPGWEWIEAYRHWARGWR